VRKCDTRAVSYCILGGIKEVVGVLSRTRGQDSERLVQEILDFGLRGVARAELLDAIENSSKNENPGGQAFFIARN
jgi:hypothetical protein